MKHFTLHQAAPSARPSAVPTDFIAEELSRYDEHLRDVRGLATATRRNRIRIMGSFLVTIQVPRFTNAGISP